MRRRRSATPGDESGFTIVEMMVAMTLLAIAMVAFAQLMFGAMSAHMATRQRSVFLELATAEMETLRAAPYSETCVSTSDPHLYTTFEGAHAVTGATCAGEAVSNVSQTTEATAHLVRRWVTWTNTAGDDVDAAAAQFKRLTVQLEWTENSGAARSIRLSSVRYPGGFGPTGRAPGENRPPVAIGTVIPQFGALPGDLVVFDGSQSTDDAGAGNLTYTWDFDDGTTRTGPIVTDKSFAATGTYQVVLTVTDSEGLSSDRLFQVSVVLDDPANLAPVAQVTASCHGSSTASVDCVPSGAVAPLSVTFDAQASTDPEGEDLYFLWDWNGDGKAEEGGPSPLRSRIFSTAGTHNVKVTAIDPHGKRSTVTVPVLAHPLNCEVLSGSFRNGAATVDNYLRIKGNNSLHETSITLRATSNTACTNLKVRMPTASGTGQLVFEGLSASSDGTTKTWTATRTVSSTTTFHLLADQTVEFIPAEATGAFPGRFTVAKDNL